MLASKTLENKSKVSLFSMYDFASSSETNIIPQFILEFTNNNFNVIHFEFQKMLTILQFTNSDDKTLSKKYAIKLIKKVTSNVHIKQIIIALNIKEFSSLWNFSSNMQDFQNSAENREILRLLAEKGLVGTTKNRKHDRKILVYKKKV
jgi:hypothetical protein